LDFRHHEYASPRACASLPASYDPAFARRLFSCRNRINSGSRSQEKYLTTYERTNRLEKDPACFPPLPPSFRTARQTPGRMVRTITHGLARDVGSETSQAATRIFPLAVPAHLRSRAGISDSGWGLLR